MDDGKRVSQVLQQRDMPVRNNDDGVLRCVGVMESSCKMHSTAVQ